MSGSRVLLSQLCIIIGSYVSCEKYDAERKSINTFSNLESLELSTRESLRNVRINPRTDSQHSDQLNFNDSEPTALDSEENVQPRIQYLQQYFHFEDTLINAVPKQNVNHFTKMLLNSNVFVDKTLFIREILIFGAKIIEITRPRYSGKSINLSMLQKFLEIEVDKKGNPLPREKSRNNKLFTGGPVTVRGERRTLRRLSIAGHQDVIRHYQGKFPVILFNLSSIDGITYQEMETAILQQIQLTISHHDYLRTYYETSNDTSYMFHFQKTEMQSFFSGRFAKWHYLTFGLTVLSRMLAKHFKTDVFVLVDNYDVPLVRAFLRFGFNSDEFRMVKRLLKTILVDTVKDNMYLRQGVLTGTVKINLEDNEGGFNNALHYSVLFKKLSRYYGFTEHEVDELLTRNPTITEPSQIKSWFNGYNFDIEVVYNPRCIAQCLANEGVIAYYWAQSDGRSLSSEVLNSETIQRNLQRLVKGKTMVSSLKDYFTSSGVSVSESAYYGILVAEGYLNAIKVGNSKFYKPSAARFYITIPNEEIRMIFMMAPAAQ